MLAVIFISLVFYLAFAALGTANIAVSLWVLWIQSRSPLRPTLLVEAVAFSFATLVPLVLVVVVPEIVVGSGLGIGALVPLGAWFLIVSFIGSSHPMSELEQVVRTDFAVAMTGVVVVASVVL